MASPAIAGQVASLLWVNPTLTYQQVYTILKSRTVEISGGVCDYPYDCQQFLYNCTTYPTDYYSTLIPTTTISPSTYDEISSFDCNYIAFATIDPNKTDSNNYHDFFINSIDFQVTDKCISSREMDYESEESYQSSFIVKCKSDTSVEMWYYENSGDCTSDNATYGGEIASGTVIGHDWFIVDCSYDDDEEDNSYDGSDCDIIFREWDSCDYDEDSTAYDDQAYLGGACYAFLSSGGGRYSYSVDCYETNDGGIEILADVYSGTECGGNSLTTWTLGTSGCDNGNYTQVLECNGLDVNITSTNGEPTTSSGDTGSDSDDAVIRHGYVATMFGSVIAFVTAFICH